MRRTNLLFYLSLSFVLSGLVIRTLFEFPVGSFLFIIGLLGQIVYSLVKIIKDINRNETDLQILLQRSLIVFISFILFSKYLYHRFGDYLGLLIIPLFIISSFFYLMRYRLRDQKLSFVSVLYLLLTIPILGFDYHNEPRKYFPKEWYDRYNVSNTIVTEIPYEFEFYETEQLYTEACKFQKSKQYFKALSFFKEARKIEPLNPIILFELSGTFAHVNELEIAVSLLDTAIMIDESIAPFYGNRGLLLYKLNENMRAIEDLKKAIKLDSTQYGYYVNLALVYYDEDMFDFSCESITKAEELEFNIKECRILRRIKRKHCK